MRYLILEYESLYLPDSCRKQKPAAMKQINATMILYKILGLDVSAPEDIEELEDMRNYLMFLVR